MPERVDHMQASLSHILNFTALAFLVSLPCGYIRGGCRRFSALWFLMIHMPIPLILFLRIRSGLGMSLIPFTVGGAVAGQIAGAYLNRRRMS